jgi:glycerol-1-phosphate dehydrogenase [NAD(P)+]
MLPKLIKIRSSLENLEEELEKLSIGNKVLIVRGKTQTWKVAEKIKEALGDYKIIESSVEKVSPQTISSLQKLVKENDIDFCLAVGGGTSIDAAKYTAYESKKPLVVFPTAPSHDGIASPNVSLRAWGKPYSLVATSPIAILYHLPTLANAPYELVRAGVGDALAKYTASRDLLLALDMGKCEECVSHEDAKAVAYEHFVNSAKIVTREIERFREEGWKDVSSWLGTESYKTFVSNLFFALFSSGLGMAKINSSIGASGSEHNIAHALECNNRKHGEKVALASIPMLYLQQNCLNEEKIFDMDWRTLREYFSCLGLPTSVKELSIKDSEMVNAVLKGLEIGKMRKRYTILDFYAEKEKLDESSVYSILKETKLLGNFM